MELSKDERLLCYAEPDYLISPLVYGETIHSSIAEILMILRDQHGLFQPNDESAKRCFYDLGSGLGKPSVTAALTLPDFLTKCVGIELLDGLYQKSLQLAAAYEQSEWVTDRKAQGKNCPTLSYEKDDFIHNSENWVSNAGVVFANATCFEPDMIQ